MDFNKGSAFRFLWLAIWCIALTGFCSKIKGVFSFDSRSFSEDGNCSPCPDNCKSCLSADECQECEPGYFGRTCSQTCSFCKDRLCNKNTGYCVTSCKSGYYFNANNSCVQCPQNCKECISGSFCSECVVGFKDSLCQSVCEKCKPGTGCDQISGYCSGACKSGLSGTFCNASCATKCASCERQQKDQCIECAAHRYGGNCTLPCPENCLEGVCNRNNGSCTRGCIDEFYGPTCEGKHVKYQITVVIIGVTVGICISMFLAICLLTRKIIGQRKTQSKNDREMKEELQLLTVESGRRHSENADEVEHLEENEIHRQELTFDNRSKHEAQYVEEFKSLTSESVQSSSKSVEKKKSRKVLDIEEIKGYKQRTYIVCKDLPTNGLKSAFWELVWDRHCETILCLTRTVKSRKKNFLPSKPKSFGDITVEVLSEDSYDMFDSGVVELKRNKQKRTIKVFLPNFFPLRGLPGKADTLTNCIFVLTKEMAKQTVPLMIYCSSEDVSLSGLYLALDMITVELESGKCVDVFQCVKYLKQQTNGIIQTVEEYRYLHEAIASLQNPTHLKTLTIIEKS